MWRCARDNPRALDLPEVFLQHLLSMLQAQIAHRWGISQPAFSMPCCDSPPTAHGKFHRLQSMNCCGLLPDGLQVHAARATLADLVLALGSVETATTAGNYLLGK